MITADVSVKVDGQVLLAEKPAEAFKPVVLSSMRISDLDWDTSGAFVEMQRFAIPAEGYIVNPPAAGRVFGLYGGTSQWKKDAPTVEIQLEEAAGNEKNQLASGWVTASSDPNDDNVALWAGFEQLLSEYSYRIYVTNSMTTDIKAFLTRFYELCLDREPDHDGLKGWIKDLSDGSKTGSDIAYGFVFSKEFLEKEIADEKFLQILYAAFFNRQPDASGKQGWLEALESGATREHVLNGFIYAAEFAELCNHYCIKAFKGHISECQKNPVEAFVVRFYQLCLDRDPDPKGLDDWINDLMKQTRTGADVAKGFINSKEFNEKGTDNEQFLTILYKAFFNRSPDPMGWDAWLEELNSGRGRGYILDGFLYSQEFVELCDQFGIRAF